MSRCPDAYNRFHDRDNSDRINPIAGPGSLDGDYVYQRFNPSIGITWSPLSTVNAYARYSQGSRAPTAIELGCADPANPCSLPNALAGDPPLQQVVTDTWEAGLRGKPELSFAHNVRWNVGAFRAENRNDILFVSSPELGTGYFQNFAKTRREGFDADLSGWHGRRALWGASIGDLITLLSFGYLDYNLGDRRRFRRTTPAIPHCRDIRGSTENIYIQPGDLDSLLYSETEREGFPGLSSHPETHVRSQRNYRVELLRARE